MNEDTAVAVAIAETKALLERVAADVSETKQHAMKTNGRVTRLEMWRARIMGAWFVVSLAGPVITGLVVAYAAH